MTPTIPQMQSLVMSATEFCQGPLAALPTEAAQMSGMLVGASLALVTADNQSKTEQDSSSYRETAAGHLGSVATLAELIAGKPGVHGEVLAGARGLVRLFEERDIHPEVKRRDVWKILRSTRFVRRDDAESHYLYLQDTNPSLQDCLDYATLLDALVMRPMEVELQHIDAFIKSCRASRDIIPNDDVAPGPERASPFPDLHESPVSGQIVAAAGRMLEITSSKWRQINGEYVRANETLSRLLSELHALIESLAKLERRDGYDGKLRSISKEAAATQRLVRGIFATERIFTTPRPPAAAAAQAA